MRRINNLYRSICSIENLNLADQKARRGKSKQIGIKQHDQNREENILALHEMLINKSFETSEYKTFIIFEPKQREIYRLPYYPDRIVHHAVMNILEPIWMSLFTADTYSCIKGRGVHKAAKNVQKALKNAPETMYCLKLDISKFYPSIDHSIMKVIIRKKIKDVDLLWLLDSIIDSAAGLPIGNYLSQYMANLYLTYFDHWLKEHLRVKYYFRYCDDLVILSGSKPYLHEILASIKDYLASKLKLKVKDNYQVFPVSDRGIDFVGYKMYHTHTLLRKSIKQSFARAVAKGKGKESIAAYTGWAKHANCLNLIKVLSHESNQKVQRVRNTT
ncbi:RNA-directed DNA polymerase [Dyadobacter sp. Leaf189]|uniref:RNA-directed DNA polymerase n=1 Tax=Dyadobacter sp. Leaf189 TaxID=1736295 RepID=UPI0006F33025|nr:RNA-directed DNA polymerase [Dyadobacter sp. Leaf189]KQS34007.1 reverse transcriptase [Dyadobacter sp. Leaf189]